MDELSYSVLRRWLDAEERIIVAMLVEVLGSAPFEPGALMLFNQAGDIEGSVTGGCVEGALAEEARRILSERSSARLLTFGISDEIAGQVGLMCGGTVRIFIAELSAESKRVWQEALDSVTPNGRVAVATVVTGPHAGKVSALIQETKIGSIDGDLLDHSVERDMTGAMTNGTSTLRRYGFDGAVMGDESEVFIRVFGRRPHLIIVGAIDFSVAVARFARDMGYAVTICDAREAFLRSPRFAAAADIVCQWPDVYLRSRVIREEDVVLVFSHDPKFDEPALISALATPARFIGAMGSRKTVADRERRLREAGVSQEDIDRVASPVGLDLGASTPGETAISILAEVLLTRTGRSGMRLGEIGGSIRRRVSPSAMAGSNATTKFPYQ